MICHAKKKDGSPCQSLAVYSDERGEFCGWHWSLLPEITKGNGITPAYETEKQEDYATDWNKWTPLL